MYPRMEAVVLHDYLSNIGGGEKLMLSLARALDADFATLDLNRDVVEDVGYGDVKFIDLGSTVKKPPLKQLHASLKYRLAKLDYDAYMFSGNWSHYAAVNSHPNIWYCHTPVRAFYIDWENIRDGMNPVQRLIYDVWVAFHSRWDRKSVKHVDKIIANSNNTRDRIKRVYGRESTVVYPGVDTGRFKYLGDGGYWLSVNRIYPEKRIRLQVNAFERMPDRKLVIVGGSLAGDHSSRHASELLDNLPPNVEYRGRVSEDELAELYGRCTGFICTAVDEDFGMTPVEAMAAGKPVVATREGGYLETVVDGETGVLAEAEPMSLKAAVEEISDNPDSYRRACERRSRDFDTSVFIQSMKGQLEDI